MKTNLFGEKQLEKGTLDEHCSCCGQLTRVYRAVFGRLLAQDFAWFVMNKDDKDVAIIDSSDYRHNSTWLSYFGILEQVKNPDGTRKSNTWRLTAHGVAVAEGKEKVPKEVCKYGDEIFPSKEEIFYKQGFGIPQNDLRSDYEVATEEIKRSYCQRLKKRYK
jgi:hypothetical protein